MEARRGKASMRSCFAAALLLALAACTPETPAEDEGEPAMTTEQRGQAARQQAEYEAAVEQRRLRDLWQYQAVTLPAGVQRSAQIASRTVAFDDEEVAPVPDAQLVLRDHPSWGRSAYLLLEQRRFDCGKPCTLQIRFDDGQPRRFAGRQADSGQGPALFISDEAGFIEAMDRAQLVHIRLPEGSGNISSLVFEVGGFDPARYAQP